MADSPRIEELRRRVQSDPASIAFAALAEEYRRAGRFEEAIAACVTGLQRHPSYLSAHVTLGRSLLEVGRYEEAQDELEHVLKLAPENLAAIRALAEIHHRRGDDAHETHNAATDTARREAAATQPAASVPVQPAGPIPVSCSGQNRPAQRRTSAAIVESTAVHEPAEVPAPHAHHPDPPELAALDEFLSAILRARADRSADAERRRCP